MSVRECCLLQLLTLTTTFSIVTAHSVEEEEEMSAKISQICVFVMKTN